jgi:hypothetical protein
MTTATITTMIHPDILMVWTMIYSIKNHNEKLQRRRARLLKRLDWSNLLERDRLFLKRALRMDFESLHKPVSILSDTLEPDKWHGDCRGGLIKTNLCLFATIRWLAGGSYLDIAALFDLSVPYFYSIVYQTMLAIIESKHPDLDNSKFSNTDDECGEASADFEEIRYSGAIKNCVSVIGGYLLSIITPSKNEVGNV